MTIKLSPRFQRHHAPSQVSVEERCASLKGRLVQIRGWTPCRVITGNISSRGDVLVEFTDGVRRWHNADKVAKAIVVYEGSKP